MASFADSLRASIEADARAHLGAEALPGTRRTIGRRRTVATVGYGALAVGAVAVAAGTLIGREDPAPASSPSPTPTASPTTSYATVDLTDPLLYQGWDFQPPLCGAPAPAPTDEAQGFTATFNYTGDGVVEQLTSGLESQNLATVQLQAHLDDKVPAYVHDPHALYVQDGTVVGFDRWQPSRQWHMLHDGWDATLPLSAFGLMAACSESGTQEPLPAGDYEMHIVTRVTASELEAAIDAANAVGVSLTAARWLNAYQPGSYECVDTSRETIGRPLGCDVSAMPGASIDFEAQTATIPYESVLYDRDVDVTLVSEPIAVQVAEYVSPHADQRDQFGEPLTADTVPVCGALYSNVVGAELSANATSALADVAPGDTLEPGLWPMWDEWAHVSAQMPATARVWLIEEHLVPHDDLSSTVVDQVAGWMEIAAVNDTAVAIDRYDGPTPWPVEVTDVSWCEGEPPEYVKNGWMLTSPTISDNDGTRTSGGLVRFSGTG